MKPTERMILQFAGEPEITATEAHHIEQGLTRALKDVPEADPFRFAGYPDREVFLHASCGTVVDAVPGTETRGQVDRGECDCEDTSPWLRVYVEKQEG